MVNIFIIVPDIYQTAKLLDNKRLGKQRVEAKQIIDILEDYDRTGQFNKKAWSNHPAVKSWIGFTNQLKVYFNIIVREWINRGFNNTMQLYQIDENLFNIIPCNFDGKKATYDTTKFNKYSFPYWVSFPPFYMSHQAALCRKDPKHYKVLIKPELYPFIDNGYLWPCNVNIECYFNWNFSYHENLSCGCPPVYRISIIDVFKWLVNPNINPNTGRQISNSSQIYLDYKNAMEKHGVIIYYDNIHNCNIISVRNVQLCRLDNITFGISYLEDFYKKIGGIPTPSQLCIFFSNL